jgi:hypothetical protein
MTNPTKITVVFAVACCALADHRHDGTDSSHDYEELLNPVHARYVRITNRSMPGRAKFSLSGMRVFGIRKIKELAAVSQLEVTRDPASPSDKRAAQVRWNPAPGAEFYIVRYGVRPDRLVASHQDYGSTSLTVRSLNTGVRHFFTVDSVSSSSITRGHRIVALQP